MNAQNLSKHKVAIALFSLLALHGCGDATQTQITSVPGPELFTEAQIDTASAISEDEAFEQTRRARFVRINFSALKSTIDLGKGTLNLNLFNDRALLVSIDRVQKMSETNIVLTGIVIGDTDSVATFVLNNDVLIANIKSGETDETFEVRYNGQGVHVVREPKEQEEEPCPAEQADNEPGDEPMVDSYQDSILATPVVDMLVAYTPRARIKQGGTAAIKALIQTGITDTNLALEYSGASMRVRLAGTLETKTSETCGWSTDLNALRSKTDSRWNEVHTERARLGADQVTLVGAYNCSNSTAGIGYINAYKSTAFSIVKASAFNMYTFAHELGHNLGLNHSDGYVNTSGRFRTIMAYGSYKRIRRFSNPYRTYNGYRTGTSYDYSVSILNANDSRVSNLLAPVARTAATAAEEE